MEDIDAASTNANISAHTGWPSDILARLAVTNALSAAIYVEPGVIKSMRR
jgi:hypothetical protein